MDTTVPAPAQHTGTWRFTAAMDNHDPVRDYSTGRLEEWTWPDDGRITYRIPDGVSLFIKDAPRALFLADDGRTVRPLYTTGWPGMHDVLFLGTLPVDVRPDGSPVMRADDPARPVDFGTWMLGPQRCFHLKITRVTPED